MKITIDLRTLMNGGKSGIPGFTYSLVENLLKSDTQNEYFGFLNSYKNSKVPNINKRIKINELGLPNKVLNPSLRFLKYPKIDKLIPSDIFYMPHFNFNALEKKTFKIITVHDLSFMRYPEFFSRKNNLWHKMIEVQRTLKTFDKIIAISENTKNDIIDIFDIPENKIKVIYSGIDDKYKPLNRENDSLREVKNKYSLPDKFILSLGTIEPRKNIDSLIKAFDGFMEKTRADFSLVIAGGMGWKYKQVIEEYQRAKYKERILFLGHVAEEDKNALYNLAQLFVFPSYYEGFGFPPLEAMKAGTAVMASANSSMLEILKDSAYFINPHNINDIENGLINILGDNNIKKSLVDKSIKNSGEYSWARSVDEYISIFNER